MERLAALLIRWGAGLSLLMPFTYWLGIRAIGRTPDDGVGVELGLAIIIVGALLTLVSLVVLGALVLWHAAISKGFAATARFENERFVGTAFLVISGVVAALMYGAF
jgi:hypothetical protein